MDIVHVLHLFVMQRISFKDWELDVKEGRSYTEFVDYHKFQNIRAKSILAFDRQR